MLIIWYYPDWERPHTKYALIGNDTELQSEFQESNGEYMSSLEHLLFFTFALVSLISFNVGSYQWK